MRVVKVLIAISVVGSMLVGAPASSAAAACADPAEGGDWALPGNTADNARHQTEETRLDASTLGNVEMAWRFRPRDIPGVQGGFSSTPIVADGCVYLSTSIGHVVALNADTGERVWHSPRLLGNGVSFHANVITGSPTVAGDAVYVGVNRNGSPYVAALDRYSGKLLWTRVVADRPSSTLVPSPVHHNGVLFQGFSGFEFEEDARGGFALLDASPECSVESATICTEPKPGATGGNLIKRHYTIPDDDYAAGYRGVGIWGTAAVDDDGYAYVGTSNPATQHEHRYANSLIKVDLERARPSFGELVGAYKGNPDNYIEGSERQPACDNFGQVGMPYYSIPCTQFDSDFGASPHLFRNSLGYLVVGNQQKSGVYHAAYADNMQRAWTTVIGPPCIWCNAASPAHDGEKVYVVSGLAAKMFALGMDKGHYRWATPVGNVFHYHPVSLANGIAYTLNGLGVLWGFDTATGIPVFSRNFLQDAGAPMAEINSSGVAIARSTVYAAAQEWVIAYR